MVVLCVGTEKKTVLVQPYSSRRGNLFAVATNYLEHIDLNTQEGREKFMHMIFTEYLQYLPDYQCVNNFELVLNTVL